MPKTQPNPSYNINQSPFYKLQSQKKLAELLHVSPSSLREVLRFAPLYRRCWKHKKEDRWLQSQPTGELKDLYRPIDIPAPRLKALQARVANLLNRIAPPEFLYSPVKGRSYVDNAAVHLGARAFWQLDIADYFPSCTANNVARFFRRDMRCSRDVTSILVQITTLDQCLPQGSPCSPILAYFANMPMWSEVARIINEAGCKLSVYADDITISGDIVRKQTVWEVKQTIYRHGLRLKPSKEVSTLDSPADITGVIVRGERALLPNRQLKRLAELRAQRRQATDPKLRARLDSQIHGRQAQRRQVEGNVAASA